MEAPKIVEIPARLLAGIRIRTCLADNQTHALWQQFGPRIKTIPNRIGADRYSVEIFDPSVTWENFSPQTQFEKWAAVEVADHEHLPEGVEPLVLPGGLYALHLHHGPASTYAQSTEFLFGTWLPASPYAVDNRPHFEVMGPDYNPLDPDAVEPMWVPIRPAIS